MRKSLIRLIIIGGAGNFPSVTPQTELLTRNSSTVLTRNGSTVIMGGPGFGGMIVCDGDSLTQGNSASAVSKTWPEVFKVLMLGGNASSRRWGIFNAGVGGQTFVDLQSDAASQIDAQLSFQDAILVAWAGINDLYVDNVNASTLESRWNTYFSARNSAGWTTGGRRLVAVTVIAAGVLSAQQNTDRASFNTWLRANYSTYATHLLDLAADSRFQNSGDTNYYNADTVHLTDLGYQTVAELASAVL